MISPAISLTEILTTEILHNSVGRWGLVFVILLAGFVAGKIIGFLLDRQAERLKKREGFAGIASVVAAFSKPASPAALGAALLACQSFLVLDVVDGLASPDGGIRALWLQIAHAIIAVSAAWSIFRLVDVIEHLLGKLTSRTASKLDDQLVPLIRKTLRVFIVIITALFIGQNIFKWNVSSIIAGLGIGGLAFALAAKDSLANLFGSIVIFADQPFAMGERIKVQGADGIVAEVGFRSTKLRTLDGHLVTIPNSVVANETVENIGRRPYIKRVMNVSLTYDTPPQQMQRAVEILREMLEARKDSFAVDLPGRAYFTDFKSDNLNILIVYWFAPPEWWDYVEFNHDFNMELLRRFNDEGLEFAFPTQTLYLKKDGQDGTNNAAAGPEGATDRNDDR